MNLEKWPCNRSLIFVRIIENPKYFSLCPRKPIMEIREDLGSGKELDLKKKKKKTVLNKYKLRKMKCSFFLFQKNTERIYCQEHNLRAGSEHRSCFFWSLFMIGKSGCWVELPKYPWSVMVRIEECGVFFFFCSPPNM